MFFCMIPNEEDNLLKIVRRCASGRYTYSLKTSNQEILTHLKLEKSQMRHSAKGFFGNVTVEQTRPDG